MTRPLKINGVPAAAIDQLQAHYQHAEETCRRKIRHCDEFVARAVGLELMASRPGPCFIYKCKWCRGWHLTRQVQPAYYAADYLMRKAYR